MAVGKLGSVATSANTNHTVYTVPDAVRRTNEVYINVLNAGVADASLKLAITKAGSPAADEYIEDGAIVANGGGVIERSLPYLGKGDKIIVNTDVAGVKVLVIGDESE